MTAIRYRPEIDGLRAIAVLSVILFHAEVWWLPGGFVGVDIFFVISGFLITQLLLANGSQEGSPILQFYERRARRILPALVVVTVVTLVASIFFLIPDQIKDLSNSLVWVAVFISNFYFDGQVGYFAAQAHELPFLHTWSLAVEEQFYLLFPLAILGMRRWSRKALGIALLVAAAISLSLAEVLVYVDAEKNFFFTFSRV